MQKYLVGIINGILLGLFIGVAVITYGFITEKNRESSEWSIIELKWEAKHQALVNDMENIRQQISRIPIDYSSKTKCYQCGIPLKDGEPKIHSLPENKFYCNRCLPNNRIY